MASNYPGSLDSFDAIASDKKTSDAVGGRTHRDMHNDLGDAIEAIETELGTDPAGAYATVKARFEANPFIGSGTGSPEGAVTGSPGQQWLQTNATTDVKGWIKWVKATGTGNTGWIAGPEADTGWRDVSASIISPWTGSLYLRRNGGQVSLLLSGVQPNGASADDIINLPSGFRASMGAYTGWATPLPAGDPGGAVYVAKVSNGGSYPFQASRTQLAGGIYSAATWPTNDAWPSSNPGSAV